MFKAELNLPEPPIKDTVLHPKAMFVYNLRCISLSYDEKAVLKPSFLTFNIIHTKSIKVYQINCHFWFMADNMENRSFLTFEALNLRPNSFFNPILVATESLFRQPLCKRQNVMGTRLAISNI